jgi:dolichyl-phosphate-mannose--protein O-mannosyl transferase
LIIHKFPHLISNDSIVFLGEKPVTCGSAVKLAHIESGSKNYLASENKSLGSGSGQQIVTWSPQKNEPASLWWLREAHNSDDGICPPGTPIRCGTTIRLTHLETKRNLHTHGIPSPLSRQQEVSAYGNEGEGDTGDDWVVECTTQYWQRGAKVRLRHVDTQKYLAGSASVKYTAQNCGQGCPIMNHLETFGRKQKDDYSYVKVDMGVLLSK